MIYLLEATGQAALGDRGPWDPHSSLRSRATAGQHQLVPLQKGFSDGSGVLLNSFPLLAELFKLQVEFREAEQGRAGPQKGQLLGAHAGSLRALHPSTSLVCRRKDAGWSLDLCAKKMQNTRQR